MVDTNILDITLLATSQSDRSTTVNTALQALETATQKALAVDLTAGNETLTEAQFTRNFNFICDGQGASARTLTVPLTINGVTLAGRFFMVSNLDSGTVTVQGATGATVDVVSGVSALIFNDGTDQRLIAQSTGITTLGGLSDVLITAIQDNQQLVYDATYGIWVNEDIPFIISLYVPQVVTDNELIMSLVFDRDVDFATGLPGSQGYANTPPADDDQWLIRQNGSDIGTVNFTMGSNAVTFTFSGNVSFSAGQRLELVADYPSDTTLAGVTLTFRGVRKS